MDSQKKKLPRDQKQSPICSEKGCLGWYEELRLRNEKWLRCRSCGFMKKVSKRIIQVE